MKAAPFIPITGRPAMAKAAPVGTRDTTPGTQPMAGPPMPAHPKLEAPKGNKQHHRANTLAKGKTKKPKHVIPPPVFR
jgi:hypothetical protein